MYVMTLYTADTAGNAGNCFYPNVMAVTDLETLKKAATFDHVCAAYKGNYRSGRNFIKADCIPMDCDNDHSEDPEEWVTPDTVAGRFPGVPFAVVYSRNHLKEKGGKSARPRFHVYFPCTEIADSDGYRTLKERILEEFPYFDAGAKDSARFIFGVENPQAEIHEGVVKIDRYVTFWHRGRRILEGTRNNHMSHYAGRIIKRLGNTDEAHGKFLKEAEKCDPPLDNDELDTIWGSAVKFGARVAAQEGYIPPDRYGQDYLLKPDDFSDVGQAAVLSREYGDVLRYSPATDYLVYNGSYWEESGTLVQGMAQALTYRQLDEAEAECESAKAEMMENGAWELLASLSIKKALAAFSETQRNSYDRYMAAEVYRKHAIKRRDTRYIFAAMREAQPMLLIEQKDLDTNEFLLNTPEGTCDLRTGEMHEHNAADYITKQTSVAPSGEGDELWNETLSLFFQGDAGLIEYVQKIVGLAAIGKVYNEALIIAYGEGRNGKSTFWNTVSRVLGTYSGNMSADTLTVGCKRNVKPEMAELKGKRLIIASELEEGMRLNTSNVKQLCSTDEIYAEKKYKAPFSFVPTHLLVLYTNHLPRVGALDSGTWRRLLVIPFNATIDGSREIKNYTDYLLKNAGGAILKWIVEGAVKIIAADFVLPVPEVVMKATRRYKEDNDWLQHFLGECCELGTGLTAQSGQVYSAYRAYCLQMGEYCRNMVDFYAALELVGVWRKHTRKGTVVFGLGLKSEFLKL